jgi:hypothetical protein
MLVVRPRRGHDRPRRGEPARLAGDAEYSLILLAARVLHALAVYGSDESLDQAAERTLQGVGASRGALVALAIQDLLLGPVELVVDGAPTDERSPRPRPPTS